MKINYFFILIFNILSLVGFAQDRIIKITRDTINAFRFAFLGGGSDSRFVISSGIRVGVLF